MNTNTREAGHRAVPDGRAASPAMDDLEDAASVFLRARPALLRVAHQILGNAGEAEDVLQEVWLRLQRTDRRAVHSPTALLRTITVRLAVNVLHSARRRREYCATPFLPEPADDHDTEPDALVERQDAVEWAVARLLATLTPRQRAAFVLREGFGYPYPRIAALLDLSVVNARQQVSRAQQRLDTSRRRQAVDAATHRRFVRAFLGAARGGDLETLERTLLRDAVPDPAQQAPAAAHHAIRGAHPRTAHVRSGAGNPLVAALG
ncbi:sigma-70 family RNA polymerase sigma factor [Streptomyces tendae]|uniref:sigma-70 family RNA polymerase sigma factor n=1 Tax=Streptomyces tendae TaxID=1932 RepID=UPI0033D313B3